MKITSIVAILLVILTFNLAAQNELADKPFLDNYRFTRIVDETVLSKNLKIADIQGTPYLETKFNIGKITTAEGAVYANIQLRYNANTDELEFKSGNDRYNIEPRSMIKRAEFGGSIFSYMPFEVRGSMQNGFLKILKEGKATLLVRFTIKFLEEEESKPFMVPKPARFSNIQTEYFLAIGGNPAKQVSNKKMLLQMFGDKKGEIESFISKSRCSIKDAECLMAIVDHFNEL